MSVQDSDVGQDIILKYLQSYDCAKLLFTHTSLHNSPNKTDHLSQASQENDANIKEAGPGANSTNTHESTYLHRSQVDFAKKELAVTRFGETKRAPVYK